MSSRLFVLLLLCGLGVKRNVMCDAQTVECPTRWAMYHMRCFLFLNTEMTWGDAERYCTSNLAHLASFHNPDEYNFIRRLIVTATGTNTKSWVGGTKNQNGDWTWSDGSDFSYIHWGPGEPNNMGGDENCMDINLNGQNYVNDEVCSQRNAFVCAKGP